MTKLKKKATMYHYISPNSENSKKVYYKTLLCMNKVIYMNTFANIALSCNKTKYLGNFN